ncbi:hypothetical protein SAMN05421770_10123 [Granulicella rosea]|uniref:DUF2071 domain-containing protein n=1 Tax=Granulicella rosea TaxID=474952 RepID=A0A239CNX0_9BACT|nr:DUF2071 domain-containing protein [Granulicella rosea]SNS21639.1 hypothetical protein SAMN05421770_10123 [Granulicella rosea]
MRGLFAPVEMTGFWVSNVDMHDPLLDIAHRPYPLPQGRWIMRQRWNDLLFAHWPIAPEAMRPLIPAGLALDTFEGQAWVGVVPFWMDRVRNRLAGEATIGVPTMGSFNELNLRTYVRSPRSGKAGVYFFSLDASSALAVLGARTLFRLPYFLAAMRRSQGAGGGIDYASRRLPTRRLAEFEASYRPTGALPASVPGTLQHFLTERYCLFTTFAGRTLVGDIHHAMWPLESAEAEIRVNTLPAAHGIALPDRPPILHFSRALEVTIWPLAFDRDPDRA